MIPKRFKAVCTETGGEFGADDLVCAGYQRDQYLGRIGLYWSVEFSGTPIDQDEPKIEICQSTGLHDANGKEVYFGDVLTTPSGSILFSIEFFRDQILGQNLDNKVLSELSDIELLTVVGNKWQPSAELKARAESLAASNSD